MLIGEKNRWIGRKKKEREREIRKGIFAWIVAVVAAVVCVPANAQSMHSLQALSDGATASSQYAGSTLWFEYQAFQNSNPGNVITAHGSAVRLNEHWGITAAHLMQPPAGVTYFNFSVGNGTNWMTDRGITRNVSEFHVHPLAVPGGFTGTEVDLAIFRWDDALFGNNVTIAPAVLNEVLSYNGFGQPATPGTGLLPIDGQRRMFETYADLFGNGGGISPDYVLGDFLNAGPRFRTLGGVGTGGNSGSGVYNATGDLVALTVAQSGSPGYLGTTISLRLDLYEPWINTYVPSPGSALLLGIGGLFACRRRRV